VIPLSCLDHPRWVRLVFGAVTFAFDPELLATGKLQPGALLAHVATLPTMNETTWA
jgi:hypothetical protein